MNEKEKRELENLLRAHLRAQDTLTRYRAEGTGCTRQAREAIASRNRIKGRIFEFVEGLISTREDRFEARVEQTATE